MAQSTQPPSTITTTQKLSPPSSSSFRLRTPSLNTLRLRRIFDLFDRNADDLITPQELSLALNRLGLTTTNDSNDLSSLLSPFLSSPDSPGLDFDGFKALHRSLGDALFGCEDEEMVDESSEEVDSDIAEAFKVFDLDGDGFISARELQAVLAKLDLEEGKSIEKVNMMIGEVDCNKDGRVDFMEFKNMMRSVVIPASFS